MGDFDRKFIASIKQGKRHIFLSVGTLWFLLPRASSFFGLLVCCLPGKRNAPETPAKKKLLSFSDISNETCLLLLIMYNCVHYVHGVCVVKTQLYIVELK